MKKSDTRAKSILSKLAEATPRLELDVAAAKIELADKHDDEIDLATAGKWASRAIAAFEMSLEEEDLKDKISRIQDGEDFRHESIEHAGLAVDGDELVKEVVDAIEPSRVKAWAQMK